MSRYIDLTGERFGRLTVVAPATPKIKADGKRETAFKCLCDCGTERIVLAYNLRNGHTQSCGCQSLEKRTAARTKHHGTGERLYRIWSHMKRRCTNPEYCKYEYYGGRGINLCDEWMNYISFRQWAINNGYQDGLTIDRIDNNSGYSPSNCRWVDMKIQSNNRRGNRILECYGESKTLAEWADYSGINATTIAYRLKIGWTMQQAIETPLRGRKNET